MFSGPYLIFHSVNPVSHKIDVVRALAQIEKKYCSNHEIFQLEEKKYLPI